MNGVALVVADADHARLHAALSLAAAAAAAGKPARLFFHAGAVASLRKDRTWPEDAPLTAAGLPSIAALIDTALELNVRLIVCQSGLALTGLAVNDLADSRIETGGLVGFVTENAVSGLA